MGRAFLRLILLGLGAILIPACGGGSGGSGGSGGGTPGSPLLGWGSNGLGQIGLYVVTTSPTPLDTLDISSGAEISAGLFHSFARLQNGSVRTWGWNAYGQIGDGTTSNRSVPGPVPGLSSSPVISIAAGEAHSVALHQDGSISAWGRNGGGQLGDGTTTEAWSPVTVVGLPASPVRAVAAGHFHTVALHQDGTLSAWGSNLYGQLGDGTTVTSSVPVSVTGLPASPVTAIAAGREHTVALHQDGSLSAWGRNGYGQLGDGTFFSRSTPIVVSGLPASPVTAIAAGDYHTIAAHQNATVSIWGRNDYGQLGDGTTTSSTTPQGVPTLPSSLAVSIAGGGHHTLVALEDGSVYSWGRNDDGQLGDGTTTDRTRPVAVVGLPASPVAALAGGLEHTVALHEDGTVTGWGHNTAGQLGDGTTMQTSVPMRIGAWPAPAVETLALGDDHTLALHDNGAVSTWGYNGDGQLGDGTTNDRWAPAVLAGLPTSPVIAIAAGDNHSVAAHQDGTVTAWGSNAVGQLGDGTTISRSTPAPVTGLPPSPVVALAAGENHSIALHQDGTVSTWGDNFIGQLGNGTLTPSPTPVSVIGLPASPVVAIASGDNHSAALHQDGTISAWGNNRFGQLGDGTPTTRSSPVQVVGLPPSPVTAIDCGNFQTYALHQNGTVSAWGENTIGQLGNGTTVTAQLTPVLVTGLPSSPVIAVAAGGAHTLALHQDGSVSGWGQNFYGQVGDGTNTTRTAAVGVVGSPNPVSAIAAGGRHTLVIE